MQTYQPEAFRLLVWAVGLMVFLPFVVSLFGRGIALKFVTFAFSLFSIVGFALLPIGVIFWGFAWLFAFAAIGERRRPSPPG